jgi:hypothetical protein
VTQRRSAVWPSAIFVWLVWAMTLAGILWSIARYGRNIPFEEDWLMVAPMTGHEPDLPRWLWSQNSEHRLPLPRLVNLGLLRATGDFRSTMVFDTLALAGVAAAMILVARGLRHGRTSLADAFFPLVFLHLGNWDNLVWGWQIQFVLPTVLACVILLIIVARPALTTPGVIVAGTLALLGLPLSGANGLLFAPTLASWFGYVAWEGRRGHRSGQAMAWAPAAAVLLTAMVIVVYFVGYEASPWNAASPSLGETLKTSVKFLALSAGPVAEKSWLLFGVVVSVILLISLVTLAVARRIRDEERLRIVGLLAFFAAVVLMALAVGWGRAGREAETGYMPTRYVLLAAPGLCAVYFTLLLYGTKWVRRVAPTALAILMALVFPFNTRAGIERRNWFGTGLEAFERDMASGSSAALLARHHHAFMLHWDESLMVAGLHQLHDAGIGSFREWEPDPAGQPAPE